MKHKREEYIFAADHLLISAGLSGIMMDRGKNTVEGGGSNKHVCDISKST